MTVISEIKLLSHTGQVSPAEMFSSGEERVTWHSRLLLLKYENVRWKSNDETEIVTWLAIRTICDIR